MEVILKKLRPFAIVLLLVLTSVYLVKFLVGGTITVDLSNLESVKNAHLFVNGQEVLSKNEGLKSFRIVNETGNKSIVVKAAGYEDFKTATSIYLVGNKTIKAALQPITASVLADSLDSGFPDKDYSVTNAKYFDHNTWLAFNVISKTDGGQAASIMAYFVSSKASWVVLNSGGDEFEFDINSPAPYIPQPPRKLITEYFEAGL